MFTAAMLAVLVAMVLALLRAALGPTTYDRILAVNAFGTKTVLLLAIHGFLMGRPDFLDIALAYALINFVGTIAVLKYFEYGEFGAQPEDESSQAERRQFVARLIAAQPSAPPADADGVERERPS